MNEVYVPWTKARDQDPEWNEVCALMIKKFGFPGDRYISRPEDRGMVFEFKSQQDSLLCKLALSEYIRFDSDGSYSLEKVV